MVQVQWSTAQLTLSCQLKRNKQARGNESCRSIPSRRHSRLIFSSCSLPRSSVPVPVPPASQAQGTVPTPVRSLSYPAAIFRKPPVLASSILFPTTASHRIASRRVASHHLRPPRLTWPRLSTAPDPASSRPTYRLHDLHHTLYPSSPVSSSHTPTTLVSFPSGDNRSTITALSFQNLFSREPDHGPAVSPRRTSNHWWWSEQSKRPAPTTRNHRRHLRCTALQSPGRARPT